MRDLEIRIFASDDENQTMVMILIKITDWINIDDNPNRDYQPDETNWET